MLKRDYVMGKYQYPIVDVSVVENIGVQIIIMNPGGSLTFNRQYTIKNQTMWDFLERLAKKLFGHVTEIKGHCLVSVDIGGTQSQWSFKNAKSNDFPDG